MSLAESPAPAPRAPLGDVAQVAPVAPTICKARRLTAYLSEDFLGGPRLLKLAFLVSMLAQEASLARHRRWAAYKARTGFLLPRLRPTPRKD